MKPEMIPTPPEIINGMNARARSAPKNTESTSSEPTPATIEKNMNAANPNTIPKIIVKIPEPIPYFFIIMISPDKTSCLTYK